MAAATAAVAVDKFEIAEGSTVTTERYKEVFTFHRVLGSGTFAATHLVTHKGTGKQFAFKAYIARASKDAELEIQVLKRVQSSSEAKTDRPDQVDSAVIRLHNWFIAHDYSIKRYILILELMAMPLNSVISGDQYTFSIQHLLRQMLTGLVELHTKKIVHGDIKPEHFMINILDKGVFKVKIIDFNLSELFSVPHAEGSSTSMTTAVGVRTPKECGNFGMKGTVGYRAPEILLKSNIHSYPVDIWALGVVFAEMVLRRYLIDIDLDDDQEDYHDATEIDILFSIVSCPSDKEWPEMVTSPRWSEDIRRNSTSKPFGGIAQELSIIGKDGMDLMSMMLKPNPDHRITAAEALRHPYLAA
jgi:serine/threonine protein kinase